MLKLSVTIITKNEERNIGRCIDSVNAIADEIIVVDSFSSDGTVKIALQKGAIVKQEIFRGYKEQKNLALQFASHDFIFSLDADEMPDQGLIGSILDIKKEHTAKCYSANRLTYFCGKPIKHGLWYPDKKLRLFDRRVAIWGGINPHDKVILMKPCPTEHLRGNILHYSYTSIRQCKQKCDYLTSVYAHSLHKMGKKSNLFKIIMNPVWEFFHGYILRLGFLDGYYGLIVSVNTVRYTFIKHFKLYQLQKEKFVLQRAKSEKIRKTKVGTQY